MRTFSRLIIILTLVAAVAFTGVGCSKKAKLARHLERANRYYAAGDYEKAEIEYINVLRLDNNFALAYGRIGGMYSEQGRLARAFRPLTIACQKDPNNLEFHSKLGLLYLQAGNAKEAGNEARFVLDHNPQDVQAPLLLADASVTPAEIEATRQRLQKLSVPQAQRAAIEVALGNLALRQHDLKSALAAYEQARTLNPKFGPLYLSLGSYYWLQKDVPHADEAFKDAMQTMPVRSPGALRYAQFKLQNGDAAGAKKILEDATQKAPDFLPALLALSEISADEKKFDDAAACLDKVLSRDPDNYEGLMLSGLEKMAQGDPVKAAAAFEKLAHAYPKSVAAFYQLGMAYRAANDIPKAISSLNQALALNPGYPDAMLALARIKIARNDFSSAIASLRQLTQKQPQLAAARLLLATAYQGEGDLDNAARIYRQLEESYPTNAEMPLLLGTVLVQQNRHDEARNELTKSLGLAPSYMLAVEKLTDLDVVDKRYTAAMQRLQKIIDQKPDDPALSLMVAKVYYSQGDLKQTAAVLNKTIESHPDFIAGYLMLANAYMDAHQYQPAMEAARKLLAKFPEQPGGLMQVAMISDGMKDYPGARDAYEKVLTINSNNSVALNNLACLYADHAQPDKALELARRARELLPRDPSTADTLGWIYYKRGEYEQALGMLQESAAAFPRVPEIQMHLGLARYMMGDEEAAQQAFRIVAQDKGDSPEKKETTLCLAIMAIDPQTADSAARAMLEKRIAEQPADGVALSRLGAIYQKDGNTDKSVTAYETALKLNPKNVHVLVPLARIYASRPQDTARALTLAKSAYKLLPDDPEVSRLLGRLALATGDYKFAYDLLKATARQRSGDSELLFNLGQAAYGEGRVEEAVTCMRSALQGGASFSHSADAQRFVDLAPLVYNPAAAANAAAQIEQALKTDPAYVPALMAMGAIQEHKPDPAAAIQTYEKALSRYPDFSPAKERLAILYTQQPGNDQRAYNLAVQAREAFPQDAELTKALGIITYRMGNYSRAIGYLQDSAVRLSGDAQLMYYLGMAQYKLHNRSESKKNLGQAINLKLPDSLAGEARHVLAELK